MRRNITGLFIAVSLLTLLAACGSSTTDNGHVTIPAGQTVTLHYEGYTVGVAGPTGTGTQHLFDAFHAAYPNITIVPKFVSQTNGVQTATAETAAGNAPDIAQLPYTNFDDIVSTLGAQPIDQIAPHDEYIAMMNHIVPAVRPLGMQNGHLYGSYFTMSTPTLFYNADIFRAAGLNPDQPPTTWDDVRADAQQIQAKTSNAALFIGQESNTDWQLQSLLASNGASTLSPDRKTATFNQPAAIAVFSQWQSFVKQGLEPNISLTDAEAAMENGKLGMFLFSSAALPPFATAAQGKFDLRTTGEPSFGAKPVISVNSGSALFVFTKDRVKAYAAWEFLRFAASQRGTTILTSELGYIPLRDDVINDPNYLQPYISKDPRIMPAVQQLAHFQPRVTWPGSNSVQAVAIYIQAVLSVVYNGQDPQTTMNAAAQRVNALLQQAS